MTEGYASILEVPKLKAQSTSRTFAFEGSLQLKYCSQ